jgi:hypothetical protein
VSLGEEDYERETAALAGSFGRIIPNVGELLATTLSAAGERLTQFMQIPGASTGTDVMLRRIRSRLPKPPEPETRSSPLETAEADQPVRAKPTPAVITTAPPVAAKPAGQPLFSAAPFPATVKPRVQPPAAPVEKKIVPAADALPDAITLVPEPVQPVVSGEPWLEVLRPMRDGFGADHCVVFLRASAGGPFILSEGLGSFAAHHQDIASVHPAEKTVFSIALARRETVVIHDSRTASLAPYLPAWFQGDTHTPAAFLLVPLGGVDQVGGLVLIGWSQPRRIELNPGHEALLNLLRSSATRLCRERERSSLTRTGT